MINTNTNTAANSTARPIASACPRAVIRWLDICVIMVFGLSVLGAITRLTGSGLSITEWAPISGVIPPIGETAWQQAFAAWQKIPQYRLTHSDVTLPDFKILFFWEWFHRLWGRTLGFVVAVPLLIFAARKQLPMHITWKILAVLVLGGLQGVIGWFMVKSGLTPDAGATVNPYKLLLHLLVAVAIYLSLIEIALSARGIPPRRYNAPLRLAIGMLLLTIAWGALVAGHRAGHGWPTWPLMDGQILPEGAFTLLPWWTNLWANPAMVQFVHRWLAMTTVVLVLFVALRSVEWPVVGRALVGGAVLMQLCLGVATVIHGVPVALAAMHQGMALATIGLLMIASRKIKSDSDSHSIGKY